MVNIHVPLLLGAVAVQSAYGFATPDEDWPVKLLKRQQPGTPGYNCHDNCGQAIIASRGPDPCNNKVFTTDYAVCLSCSGPDNYDIWKMYGRTLSTAGAACKLSTTPLSGKQPDPPAALPANGGGSGGGGGRPPTSSQESHTEVPASSTTPAAAPPPSSKAHTETHHHETHSTDGAPPPSKTEAPATSPHGHETDAPSQTETPAASNPAEGEKPVPVATTTVNASAAPAPTTTTTGLPVPEGPTNGASSRGLSIAGAISAAAMLMFIIM